jgi:hypothetical protein
MRFITSLMHYLSNVDFLFVFREGVVKDLKSVLILILLRLVWSQKPCQIISRAEHALNVFFGRRVADAPRLRHQRSQRLFVLYRFTVVMTNFREHVHFIENLFIKIHLLCGRKFLLFWLYFSLKLFELVNEPRIGHNESLLLDKLKSCTQ